MLRRDFLATLPLLSFLPKIRLASKQQLHRLVWFVEGIYTAEGCDTSGLYQIIIDRTYGNRKGRSGEWKDKLEIPGSLTLVCAFDREPIKGERLRYSLFERWAPMTRTQAGARWREVVDDHLWVPYYKGTIIRR